jgi:nicotinamide mononucleotide transporter
MEAVLNFLTAQAEIIGTVTAVICVILIVKQNSLNFPIGIIKDFFLLYVFVKYNLYASTFSQIVLIILSFYGWYKWLRGGENQTELKISRLDVKETVICFAVWFFGSLGLATVLVQMAKSGYITEPSYVYWDSSITVAIFIAYWLMARKKLENWLVWLLFVNLQYLILNPIKGLYFFTFLQIIYISLAVFGFNTWLKDWRKNEVGKLANESA